MSTFKEPILQEREKQWGDATRTHQRIAEKEREMSERKYTIPEAAVEAARLVFGAHAEWRYRQNWHARGTCMCGETLPEKGNIHREFGRHQMTKVLEAAAPIIRADERRRVIAEIRATNLGAPLVLSSDETARFLTGPELREQICAFIAERNGE